jgi:hypothetical protein
MPDTASLTCAVINNERYALLFTFWRPRCYISATCPAAVTCACVMYNGADCCYKPIDKDAPTYHRSTPTFKYRTFYSLYTFTVCDIYYNTIQYTLLAVNIYMFVATIYCQHIHTRAHTHAHIAILAKCILRVHTNKITHVTMTGE